MTCATKKQYVSFIFNDNDILVDVKNKNRGSNLLMKLIERMKMSCRQSSTLTTKATEKVNKKSANNKQEMI